MKRKNGMIVLKEEGKNRYGGFQGVVVTVDPNTILDNKKKIYLKEVHFSEEAEGYKAWTIDKFYCENNISTNFLKQTVTNLLREHPETIEMGIPEIAITSNLEEILSC